MVTTVDMMGGLIGRLLSPGALMPCCSSVLGTRFSDRLKAYGGEEDSFAKKIVGLMVDDAPFLAEILKIGSLVTRVINSEKAPPAEIWPFHCPYCNRDSALMTLSAPFLLAIWRLQMVILGLINEAETCDDGRTKIRWRPPNQGELSQLDVIYDSYFGPQEISMTRIDELLTSASGAPTGLRKDFEHGIRIAPLWILAHEAAHLLPDRESVWRCSDIVQGARHVAKAHILDIDLSSESRSNWETELEADALGTNVLILALYKNLEGKNLDDLPMRQAVISQAATGICMALNTMEFFAICRSAPADGDRTHPGCGVRWSLITKILRTSGIPPGDIFRIPKLLTRISERLFDEWELHSSVRNVVQADSK